VLLAKFFGIIILSIAAHATLRTTSV